MPGSMKNGLGKRLIRQLFCCNPPPGKERGVEHGGRKEWDSAMNLASRFMCPRAVAGGLVTRTQMQDGGRMFAFQALILVV